MRRNQIDRGEPEEVIVRLFPGDSVEELYMPKEVFERYEKSLCWYCNGPMKRQALPGDVIVTKKPQNLLVQSVYGYDGMVVRTDFLTVIGEQLIQQAFRLGTLLDHNGRAMEGFATIYPRKPLLLRNQKPVPGGTLLCRFCGRIVLTAADPALLRSQVKSDFTIAANKSTWFLMLKSLWERFPKPARRQMRIDEVPVLQTPQDGLPDRLNPWPTSLQRKAYIASGGVEDYVRPVIKKSLREDGLLVPGEDFDPLDRAEFEKWRESLKP